MAMSIAERVRNYRGRQKARAITAKADAARAEAMGLPAPGTTDEPAGTTRPPARIVPDAVPISVTKRGDGATVYCDSVTGPPQHKPPVGGRLWHWGQEL